MPLRNIAIIAHVDHGKTTLVDQMLAQSGVFRANEAHPERAMDSNDQERERGITILAKATSVLWHGAAGETRINIIDTPGHADFGGEVERILGMVDGCLLLVDAEEGVMPQTKFVLGKALKLGLRPIVVLNKVDRPHADPDRVLNDAFDLFAAIGATDDQLDFPHLYASGKQGWAVNDMADEHKDLAPLFDKIVEHVPAPAAEARVGDPAQLLAVLVESDPFLGRLLTGRVESGRLVPGMTDSRPLARRRRGGARTGHQAAGFPRPQAPADRRGGGRRHRRRGGADQSHRGRHPGRSWTPKAPCPPSRSIHRPSPSPSR